MSTYFGLDHVQLAVPLGAEAEGRAFYGGVLGLQELPKLPEMAKRGGLWFVCGAQQLHLGVEAEFRAAKKAHPAIALADRASFDGLAARLAAAGYPVRHDDEMEPSVSRFFSTDPWGNRLEFVLARADDDLAGTLLLFEERLFDPSFRASSEVAALLAPEFVEIGRSGRTYDRAETLAALAADSKTTPSSARAIRDFTVRRLSSSFARATYRIEAREGDSMRASIWRRSATGAWQLVFHQGTPLRE